MAKKSTNQPDVLKRDIAIANIVAAAITDAAKKAASKPDHWTKALTIANILLAIFTLAYVLLTYNVLYEMKQQNELARRNLQETLKPQLLIVLDLVQLHARPFGGHPANTFTGQVRLENNGNTPADIQYISLDAFPFDRHQANARDSLLNPNLANTAVAEVGGSAPKIIPPHGSIRFIAVIQDISDRIRSDGTFYIHYLIIFTDVFNSYHDVYSVARFDIEQSRRRIGYYPPAYSFHDYTESETRLLLQKTEGAVNRGQ